MRYFIQHIGGDPIALRYVKHDTIQELTDKTWEAQWTENPEERAEWLVGSDAHAARALLGMGVVRHTDPEPADIDEQARIEDRLKPASPVPPIVQKQTETPPPWWQQY